MKAVVPGRGSHAAACALDAADVLDDAGAGELTRDVPWTEMVPFVRRTVRRIVGPGPHTDDLTQAALERVVRGMHRFQGRAELTTYVYKITANVALNHWRGWRRWLRRFDPTVDVSLADDTLAVAAEDAEPHGALERAQRAARLHALLDRLDAKQRIVLLLADFEDLPASRIAEIVGCPEPTVRSRLRLARARLAEMVRADPVLREEDPS